MDVLVLFLLTVLQNASFTLVSRARNSKSLAYHAGAAVLSNGVWLLVIRKVVLNLDSWVMMGTYVAGAVAGSVLMHYLAMRVIERERPPVRPPVVSPTLDDVIRYNDKG